MAAFDTFVIESEIPLTPIANRGALQEPRVEWIHRTMLLRLRELTDAGKSNNRA